MDQNGEPSIFAFDNSYARLPDRFFARVSPTPVVAPKLIQLNEVLTADLGLNAELLSSPQGVAWLSGNELPSGSVPIAMAYAGHQFGQFVPQLGDGRAIMLGEIVGCDGLRYDIQLKGAGRTPFSRNGDGRAALGPVLREYIVSEAMASLGIPTTRSLAAVTTGDVVVRDTALPGAILTRVAASHIRIGTFQYFAAWGDRDGIRLLADYVIARHYPACAKAPNPYRAFFEAVIERQAELVARWLLVGFIHGVMNTDNMAISGETIDYGPCAFLDAYDPAKTFSSIDVRGRYAYGNQPRIAHWNLSRLAETLLPFFAESEEDAVAAAQEALDGFAPKFNSVYTAGLCRKIGLQQTRAGDVDLAKDLLARMSENHADFTLTFRRLCDAVDGSGTAVRALFGNPESFDEWAVRWRQRLAEEAIDQATRSGMMRAANPAFIPRNHRIEEAITAAVGRGDFAPFRTLLMVLSNPYSDQPGFENYADPPRPDQIVEQTFCGT
ncbi:protein adenylyltransferase SelO family protein [Rhizomicrobium palustre]|uniref:protein adenylyltransferase SelO family protein n=1 Tax=Rhizomicrobium palustre TaxID=189966 RepID=UPI00141FB1FC